MDQRVSVTYWEPEDAGTESRTRPSTNTLTNVPFNFSLSLSLSFYLSLSVYPRTCGMTDKAPSDPTLPSLPSLRERITLSCACMQPSVRVETAERISSSSRDPKKKKKKLYLHFE